MRSWMMSASVSIMVIVPLGTAYGTSMNRATRNTASSRKHSR
jgi:hypothetical protein